MCVRHPDSKVRVAALILFATCRTGIPRRRSCRGAAGGHGFPVQGSRDERPAANLKLRLRFRTCKSETARIRNCESEVSAKQPETANQKPAQSIRSMARNPPRWLLIRSYVRSSFRLWRFVVHQSCPRSRPQQSLTPLTRGCGCRCLVTSQDFG